MTHLRILGLVFAVCLFGGFATSETDACDPCGCSAPCQPTLTPVTTCRTVCKIRYERVCYTKPVTVCKRVCCVDACGCPTTKLVRQTKYVKCYKRVPVKTYEKVYTTRYVASAPACGCAAPASCGCATVAVRAKRPCLLDRLAARRAARAKCNPCL